MIVYPHLHIYTWKRKLEKLFQESNTHYSQRGRFLLDRMLSPSISAYVKGKLKDTVSPRIEQIWLILLEQYGGVGKIVGKISQAHRKIGAVPCITGASPGTCRLIQDKTMKHLALFAAAEDEGFCVVKKDINRMWTA